MTPVRPPKAICPRIFVSQNPQCFSLPPPSWFWGTEETVEHTPFPTPQKSGFKVQAANTRPIAFDKRHYQPPHSVMELFGKYFEQTSAKNSVYCKGGESVCFDCFFLNLPGTVFVLETGQEILRLSFFLSVCQFRSCQFSRANTLNEAVVFPLF